MLQLFIENIKLPIHYVLFDKTWSFMLLNENDHDEKHGCLIEES